MDKFYTKEIKLRNDNDEVIFTIKDLTLELELDLDMIYELYKEKLSVIVKRRGIKEDDVDKIMQISIRDIVREMSKDDIVHIARFGRENIVEFADTPYLTVAILFYNVCISFYLYRLDFKKK